MKELLLSVLLFSGGLRTRFFPAVGNTQFSADGTTNNELIL